VLIGTDKPAVTRDIGGEDGSKTAFDIDGNDGVRLCLALAARRGPA
jgi:hypothetical protein